MPIRNYLPVGAREFIDRHPKFQSVLSSFSYLFSERVIKILIGFFVHTWLARHLGPQHFGKLSYVVKTVTVFFAFGLFGVDELIIKYIMEGRYKEEDISKTVLSLRLKMSVIGLIALGVFLVIFQPEGLMFSLITFCYGANIFLQAFNVFELSFHARMDFKPLFWANNISYLTASFLRVVGILINASLTFFLSTYLIGEVILKALVLNRVDWKKAFAGSNVPALTKELAKESWPYFLSSFVILLDQRLSFLFIEMYRTLDELGNYSVAVTLIDLWAFLPMAIAASVFPTIVTAYQNNRATYEIRIQYLTDVLQWLAILFATGVILTSEHITHILYGSSYENAYKDLNLYVLTMIPMFFNLGRIKWMTLENRLVEWLIINAFCLVLNLVGHILLVPLWGVTGAIVSYLAAQIIGNLVMVFFFESSRKSLVMFLRSLTFPFRFGQKLLSAN